MMRMKEVYKKNPEATWKSFKWVKQEQLEQKNNK